MGKAASKSTSKPTAKASSSAKKTPFKKPKTLATAHVKKKKRVYTEKELGVPTLNMITPAGVQKVRGKKKGKVFVDDQESMMTILAIVNAEKEGQIESKMIKAVCFHVYVRFVNHILTQSSVKWKKSAKLVDRKQKHDKITKNPPSRTPKIPSVGDATRNRKPMAKRLPRPTTNLQNLPSSKTRRGYLLVENAAWALYLFYTLYVYMSTRRL
jgi:60S ribosomal subunit assembly/export protein LOC1